MKWHNSPPQVMPQNCCLLASPWSPPQFLDSCISPFKPAGWSVLPAVCSFGCLCRWDLSFEHPAQQGQSKCQKICACTATAPEGTSSLLHAAGISTAFGKKLALDTWYFHLQTPTGRSWVSGCFLPKALDDTILLSCDTEKASHGWCSLDLPQGYCTNSLLFSLFKVLFSA